MQISSLLLSLVTIFTTAAAVTVAYDASYDVSSTSLSDVSCSNSMISKGYSTLGSLPRFPNIAGASTIQTTDSASCGKCYSLTFNGRSIKVLAVDSAPVGFKIGLRAMNALTGGHAEQLGRINAKWSEVDSSFCGM